MHAWLIPVAITGLIFAVAAHGISRYNVPYSAREIRKASPK